MSKLTPVLFGILILVTGTFATLYALERGRHREDVLRLENEKAAADSTHREVIQVRDTAIAVVSRIAFQRQVELTAAQRKASRAEGLQATAQARITVLRAALARVQVAAAAADPETGAVTATDTLYAADTLGVTVAATVEIDSSRTQSTWAWFIVREAIPLTLTLGCQGTQAMALLDGPTWARIDLPEVVQDDEVCVPAPSWSPFRFQVPSVVEASVIGGGAILLWELGKGLLTGGSP